MTKTPYNEYVNFADFIEAKYKEWYADKRGQEGSFAKFARHLGIEPNVATEWRTRGKTPKDDSNVDKLIAAYGVLEIYSIIGWPSILLPLPLDERIRLAEALFEIRTSSTAEGIKDSESPESLALSIAILAKHGFKSSKTS